MLAMWWIGLARPCLFMANEVRVLPVLMCIDMNESENRFYIFACQHSSRSHGQDNQHGICSFLGRGKGNSAGPERNTVLGSQLELMAGQPPFTSLKKWHE